MPDELAFLRTILEDPDHDGPRLVYADWLEETGETARAEFIRVQIELARLANGNSHGDALRAQERNLLKRFRQRWIRRVGGFVRDAEFERGMIDHVRVTGADMVRHSERLFERAAVTRLRLTNAAEDLGRIAKLPALRWLRSLDIGYNGLGANRIEALFDVSHAARLRSLDLSANAIGAFPRLAESLAGGFPVLEELNLSRVGLAAQGLRLLGERGPARLIRLTLDSNRLHAGGLLALSATALAGRLHVLSLHGTGLGDDDAVVLAESGQFPHLTELNLSANAITDDGAVALAHAPALAALETLDLSYNQIGQRGALAIAQSRYFDDIRLLSLTGNRVGRMATAALRRRFGPRVQGLPTDS